MVIISGSGGGGGGGGGGIGDDDEVVIMKTFATDNTRHSVKTPQILILNSALNLNTHTHKKKKKHIPAKNTDVKKRKKTKNISMRGKCMSVGEVT